MVLNKSLQVITPLAIATSFAHAKSLTGNQHSEHECGACGSDVQELPVECALPFRRSVIRRDMGTTRRLTT
jgi:hypothetical protein